MPELERDLRALASFVDLPAERDLAPAVEPRLNAPGRRSWRRPLAVALALVAVALATALAVPHARAAILRFFGFESVRIEFVDRLPAIRPTGTLELGRRTSIEEAAELAAFEILAPSPEEVGTPDAVYIDADGRVSFLFGSEDSVRLLVTEFVGTSVPGIVKKIAGSGTRVEYLVIAGATAYWLEGAPHFFAYVDEHGELREETLRVAGNVLLWQRGSTVLRLEGAATRAQALRIARSFR
jgi:hypothetical protein